MLGLLKNAGLQLTADPGQADVIVVNTCCFIEDAQQESINAILKWPNTKSRVSAGLWW